MSDRPPLSVPALRALLAAATSGPWRKSTSKPPKVQYVHAPNANTVAKLHDAANGEANAALICAAVNALPQLLAIAEAANEVDDAIVVYSACGTPEGKARFLASLNALGDAVDAARKETT